MALLCQALLGLAVRSHMRSRAMPIRRASDGKLHVQKELKVDNAVVKAEDTAEPNCVTEAVHTAGGDAQVDGTSDEELDDYTKSAIASLGKAQGRYGGSESQCQNQCCGKESGCQYGRS